MEAAAAVFAARGRQVDVREIARCAGVGMGTLYRHFPTKDELLDTVLHEDFLAWTRSARQAAADHRDPWEALSAFLDDALARQSRHRAMLERFADSWDTTPAAAECTQRLRPIIDELLARCHEAEVLRPDVTSGDISLLLISLGRIVQVQAGDQQWRRLLQISLDGLRPCHGETLPPASPVGSPLSSPAPPRPAIRGQADGTEGTAGDVVTR
ncbi:MAG: TetR family transcriptional regulator [Pseudonocardiaceae bacterium]|nr:TetR family transcriptional regulator [Pseudonocardiaceae bacterium]